MKRLLLELGGKGAAIVFDDADLKNVISNVSSTWTFHSGQICTSPTRIVVQRGVYDELVGKLSGMAPHLKVGDRMERDTVLGPVITEAHRIAPRALIRSATDEGATRRRRQAPRARHRLLRRPHPGGRRHQPDDHRPRRRCAWSGDHRHPVRH